MKTLEEKSGNGFEVELLSGKVEQIEERRYYVRGKKNRFYWIVFEEEKIVLEKGQRIYFFPLRRSGKDVVARLVSTDRLDAFRLEQMKRDLILEKVVEQIHEEIGRGNASILSEEVKTRVKTGIRKLLREMNVFGVTLEELKRITHLPSEILLPLMEEMGKQEPVRYDPEEKRWYYELKGQILRGKIVEKSSEGYLVKVKRVSTPVLVRFVNLSGELERGTKFLFQVNDIEKPFLIGQILGEKQEKERNSFVEEKDRKEVETAAFLIMQGIRSDPLTLFTHEQLLREPGIRDHAKWILPALAWLVEQGQIQEYRLHKRSYWGIAVNPNTDWEAIFVEYDRNPKYGKVKLSHLEHFLFTAKVPRFLYLLPGDVVKVRITEVKAIGKRSTAFLKVTGVIFELVHRPVDLVVGVVVKRKKQYAFIPKGLPLKEEFDIKNPVNELKHNTLVTAKFDRREWKKVEIQEVIGSVGDHEAEMHAIIREFRLPTAFPEEVLEEAERLPEEIPESEIRKRRDFRSALTFTIDPFDAKDFDDALSIQTLPNGRYLVGVHIADVSYYVEKGSYLDKEAYRRGTSVYLVDRTIPMLPERLSNHLCSLVPNQDRLTYSAVFELDEEGNIYSEWFGETIIHSDRRFTYEEAQELIEHPKGELGEALAILNRIARNLRARRIKEGSLIFPSQEIKFELDETGKPIRAYVKKLVEANELIEDFMLLANRRVAEYLYRAYEEKQIEGALYRVHESPSQTKLAKFSKFLGLLGYKIDTKKGKELAQEINRIMKTIEGSEIENLVSQVAVRSMEKAKYSAFNIGHFGLGFSFYTHFTSPIRRYPDLVVHRIMKGLQNNRIVYTSSQLEHIAEHTSIREVLAEEAERASVKYKQVEYIQDFLGYEFDGIISGVTEWGIYVTFSPFYCEGMVALRTLPTYYMLDEDAYTLRPLSSGYPEFRLGDSVRVKVVGTNLIRRQIDLELVAPWIVN